MTRVLVIIVSYNGMPWLERCLGSVYPGAKTCHFAPDLYVWDNDSTDGSADYVAKHFPGAHLVRSAENVGFAKANNMGFQYALDHGYDYVYLLNYQAFDLQFAKLYHGSVEVKRIMAAHWLVPVRALKTVGPFEEELFPLYGQDDDWCNRVRYHGLKVGVVPGAKAVHDRALRQETKEKVIRRNYYTGSLIRLCDPNRPLWERFLFVCLFTLVKSVKYGSLLPCKYFRQICGQLPAVRRHRDFSIRC